MNNSPGVIAAAPAIEIDYQLQEIVVRNCSSHPDFDSVYMALRQNGWGIKRTADGLMLDCRQYDPAFLKTFASILELAF